MMNHRDLAPGRHLMRFKRVPEGYTRHKAKDMPCLPDEYVDVIVRTAQGFGIAGPMKAFLHDWNPDNHPRGIGAVVAYKVVGFGQ
jgi:hypothetical protein